MSNRYQKEIDHCHVQIAKCKKNIKMIKLNEKFSFWLIVFCVLCAIVSLVAQEYKYALFMSTISLVNYVIIRFSAKMIPDFEKHIENYNGLIKDWQDCDNMADYVEALKKRNDELEKSLS